MSFILLLPFLWHAVTAADQLAKQSRLKGTRTKADNAFFIAGGSSFHERNGIFEEDVDGLLGGFSQHADEDHEESFFTVASDGVVSLAAAPHLVKRVECHETGQVLIQLDDSIDADLYNIFPVNSLLVVDAEVFGPCNLAPGINGLVFNDSAKSGYLNVTAVSGSHQAALVRGQVAEFFDVFDELNIVVRGGALPPTTGFEQQFLWGGGAPYPRNTTGAYKPDPFDQKFELERKLLDGTISASLTIEAKGKVEANYAATVYLKKVRRTEKGYHNFTIVGEATGELVGLLRATLEGKARSDYSSDWTLLDERPIPGFGIQITLPLGFGKITLGATAGVNLVSQGSLALTTSITFELNTKVDLGRLRGRNELNFRRRTFGFLGAPVQDRKFANFPSVERVKKWTIITDSKLTGEAEIEGNYFVGLKPYVTFEATIPSTSISLTLPIAAGPEVIFKASTEGYPARPSDTVKQGGDCSEEHRSQIDVDFTLKDIEVELKVDFPYFDPWNKTVPLIEEKKVSAYQSCLFPVQSPTQPTPPGPTPPTPTPPSPISSPNPTSVPSQEPLIDYQDLTFAPTRTSYPTLAYNFDSYTFVPTRTDYPTTTTFPTLDGKAFCCELLNDDPRGACGSTQRGLHENVGASEERRKLSNSPGEPRSYSSVPRRSPTLAIPVALESSLTFSPTRSEWPTTTGFPTIDDNSLCCEYLADFPTSVCTGPAPSTKGKGNGMAKGKGMNRQKNHSMKSMKTKGMRKHKGHSKGKGKGMIKNSKGKGREASMKISREKENENYGRKRWKMTVNGYNNAKTGKKKKKNIYKKRHGHHRP